MYPIYSRLKEKRLWLVYILFPVISALLQYYLDNSFYGLIILVGLLALAVISRPLDRLLVWEACLIVIFFTTSTATAWLGLAYIDQDTVRYFDHVQSEINRPGSGLQVLPPRVQQILSLLQEQQILTYQLSPQLQDPHLSQRIMEATWPIKREEASAYRLQLIDEPLNEVACIEIDRTEEIRLAYCP